VLCNHHEQFYTNAEVDLPAYLPRVMPSLSPKFKVTSDEDIVPSVPCWLVINRESNADDIGIGFPPNLVHVDNTNQPDVDALNSKFGMSYTIAHVIETRLAKMLSNIQAPKQMYFSILKWGCEEAYKQGYNFVPHHGKTPSLISSFQTQLHLDHF
jgi:hypothetical protein